MKHLELDTTTNPNVQVHIRMTRNQARAIVRTLLPDLMDEGDGLGLPPQYFTLHLRGLLGEIVPTELHQEDDHA